MALEHDIASLVEASEALTSTVDNKIQSIDSALSAALSASETKANQHLAKVDAQLSKYTESQSHFRVTKNQALIPKEDGSFPKDWSAGYLKQARLVETVETGVEPQNRTDLAREFLRAIGSDTKYFAKNFNIWEMEFLPYRNVTNENGDTVKTYSYMMYQYLRRPTYVTCAAIVKHIRGAVPTGFWCSGLEANAPAKVCGGGISHNNRNFYTHCHPYIHGETLDLSETTVIQIALPAVVTGNVPIANAWGQFPYLGDSTVSAYEHQSTPTLP
ncbi:hypothetical protein CWB99_06565 [Pseudoalteromonas rubra]|uniref:Uncharacterized protein n=1 Tax=Pseudoalteromonas rubra TaxID=43658 RepID=A0A5S3WPT7_9GAMM|nr:hypothetical protein [Pseudoalteromonas rubra]TMP30400.1 hypothetical protein CWB99_06565 [Pseudoalteromonas rubra]TMP35423.1 hypothetical protein CWC00_04625 [Pseudoalteromonas rubra]